MYQFSDFKLDSIITKLQSLKTNDVKLQLFINKEILHNISIKLDVVNFNNLINQLNKYI